MSAVRRLRASSSPAWLLRGRRSGGVSSSYAAAIAATCRNASDMLTCQLQGSEGGDGEEGGGGGEVN